MAKIYEFPSWADRAYIHTAVQLYAHGNWSRQRMNSSIARVMNKFGVKRLSVEGYTVRLTEHITTARGMFPVIIIETTKVMTRPFCPACSSGVAGYLAGDETVTVMCRDCGCIYQFREVGHENSGDAG